MKDICQYLFWNFLHSFFDRKKAEEKLKTENMSLVNINETLEQEVKETKSKAAESYGFILHEDASKALDIKFFNNPDEKEKLKNTKKIALAVGCEGGFSEKEFQTLNQAGFLPLHFNINVLRAETAALYGIAVVQQVFEMLN